MSQAALLRDRVYEAVKSGLDSAPAIAESLGVVRHRVATELCRLAERDMIRHAEGRWRLHNKACLLSEYWK